MKPFPRISKIIGGLRRRPGRKFARGRGSDGFLLIAVLLILSLLTVLVVASVMVAQLERRAASNGVSNQLAQQNALFALKVAVGQLQREAGPDQRVTARADILTSATAPTLAPPSTGPSSSNGSTAYWTGVWRTYNPGASANEQLDVGTAPNLRNWSTSTIGPHWLISLPSNALTLTPATPTTLVNKVPRFTFGGSVIPAVTVANVGTGGATATPVNVPMVPMITSRTTNSVTKQVQTGQYAYWVSDEGIKAKANLIDPNLNIDPGSYLVDSERQFLAPVANALYKILPNPLNSDFRNNSNSGSLPYPLSRVTSPLSLQYMPNGAANGWTATTIGQHLADITTYSMGVLADVRKGGLKTDLTGAFESSTSFKTLFPAVGMTNGSYDAQYVYREFSGSTYTSTPNYGQTVATAASGVFAGGVWPGNFDGKSSNTDASGNAVYYDGLPWQTLYYFYNLYKSSIPSLVTSPTGTQANNTTDANSFGATGYAGTSLNWLNEQYGGGSGNNAVVLPLAPVVLAWRTDLSLSVNAPAGNIWSVTLKAYPQMILWNPFSIPLTPPAGFAFNKGSAVFRFNALLMWVAPTGTPTASLTNANANAKFPLNGGSTGGRNSFATLADATPFKPGEIRVYSLAKASDNSSAGTINWVPNVSSPSIGAAYPMLNFTNPNSAPTSLVANSPDGDWGQTMTVSLGSTDIAGNTLTSTTASADYFHVLIGTYAGGNTATSPPVNDSVSLTKDYTFGGTDNEESATTTTYWPVNPGSGRLGEGAGPNVTLPSTTDWSASPGDNSLLWTQQNGPFRIAAYVVRMKGLKSSVTASSITGWNNVTTGTNTTPLWAVPMFMGNTSFFNVLNDDIFATSGYEEVYGQGFNVFTGNTTKITENASVVNPTEMGSVWGYYSAGDQANVGADGTSNTTNQVVLYDIPNQPMVSLGQFMHMPLYIYNNPATFEGFPGATMFVGGSLASPEVPLADTANLMGIGNNMHLYLDNSFLANQALFDSYFLSTVPPSGGFVFSGGKTPAGVYTNLASFNSTYILNNKPLPNGRMRYYFDNGAAPTAATLQSPYLAAANLMVDGAFNVNSTSPSAWTAFLSSLNGNQLQLWNASSNSPSSYSASASTTYIPRFWSGTSGTTGSAWDGTHPLTDAQIATLANNIITQVKLRGPFLSMADFLNRRLAASSTVTDLTRGALQAAIDNSGINANVIANDGVATSAITTGPNTNLVNRSLGLLPSVNSIAANTAVGIPAYLMQQDIVQAFAPVMTVRSDTFVIRVYGEADNPSTKAVEGQAWGEAVVQRLPDFVDQTDPALTADPAAKTIPPITTSSGTGIGNATPLYQSAVTGTTPTPIVNTTNLTFGRRFKIVSFHWLNPNDL